jgi:hypothetical protein
MIPENAELYIGMSLWGANSDISLLDSPSEYQLVDQSQSGKTLVIVKQGPGLDYSERVYRSQAKWLCITRKAALEYRANWLRDQLEELGEKFDREETELLGRLQFVLEELS